MAWALLAGLVLAACSREGPDRVGAPDFAGAAACAECHAGEAAGWQGSHHDLAMQKATGEAVLGDFDGATLAYAGVTTTFFRRDGRYFVRTDGADGQMGTEDDIRPQ